ncbi:MAG: nitrogenase molybdenum-iron protein alpha chain [Spirochaetes bacterium GWF1_31_7]|nr:MAG: nitrogenase molybdenum-iron protein alpha chain [Spirochaetes bacterium GWE1_32_154]OHD46967.1 MAG: nitrogenase molybdenum-iron protein alpha chain [Spirochaetes bacterium GWF1_31_7]OHD49747.1 MAG: nitrogenase molybdenum-iron protein alpha chain [Spirochaetes bacterium GWE2_31_10]HBD95525.1 nitrogenase molybdenum-iron protein alpha chain [Spirochaetia bacterium]HBI36963.1 nitrogenase molybdenum-iron protein alpha chain [Spirochaetia bacterium]
MNQNTTISPEEIKDELLRSYPAKVAKKRAKQIIINSVDKATDEVPEIMANVRTIPGILTMRGCSYAGCRGVVLGPTRDILQITHGPIGCGFYAWLTRRNQTKPATDKDENFMTYSMSTDMTENEIIFGGEKKLKAAIEEAISIFHPKAIGIFATCPVGLIGDDIHAVAREMESLHPEVNIFGFSCEGYRGVSQSAGHHVANNKVFTDVVGLNDTVKEGKYKINLLGEYNIGGDAFELDRIFEKCGITVVSTFSGNSTYDDFTRAHTADLNLVMCHRSINYLAEMMEKKYGLPWFKVNFIGAYDTAKSLRKIGEYFGDKELKDKIEKVIAEEMIVVEEIKKDVTTRTTGKTAMLFVGGSRAHHYQELFKEMGMKTISAGYEFAHRDDYEGRKVLPTVKIDADSRNIEELKVSADPEKFKERKKASELDSLKANKNMEMNDYIGMMPEMDENTLIIDDLNHHEAEVLIEKYKPDIFCAGIKEKYVVQKSGVPVKQLHSYDYSGPYAGFVGAVNFYKEIDRMVNSKVWKYVKAPWEKETQLAATYACD